MATKRTVTAKADDLKPLRDRFDKIADLRRDDFKRYRDDLHFLFIDHWPKDIRSQRDQDKRLTLEVDKLEQYVHQVINDSRMNRPQMKVSPVSGGSKEVAEMFDGLLRHIQDRSNADAAFDIALECAVTGGFGYLRVLYENAHENTIEKELAIKSIANPLTVYFGMHKEPDGSDCMECFVVEDVPLDEFKEEWPDADITDWQTDGKKYGDWIGETVRVAERYWVVRRDRIFNILTDGSVISDEDYQAAKAQLPPGVQMPAIVDTKASQYNVVKWAKFCGSSYLEEERDTIWSWIPIIPVYGNTRNIDGEVQHVSMIHNSKDAQLLYDYSRSAFAERVGQTPEAPFLAPGDAVDPYLDEWDGSRKVRVQRYKHMDDAGNIMPAPSRTNPSDIPAGFAQDMEMSEHDIQGTLGMYQASLGRQGNATSGVQEHEQASRGDIATFHYHDNLARALKQCGQICVYAAPKVYDSRRVVRLLGVDGSSDTAQLDPTLSDPHQQIGAQTIFNLTLGTYGVTVSVGPSFQTRRKEAAAQMAQLATSDPQFLPLYGDFYFKAQDFPFSDEMAQRAKMLLPPQVQQADDGQNPEVAAVKAQAQAAQQQSGQVIQQLQQQNAEQLQELNALKGKQQSGQNDLLVRDAEIRLKDKELNLKAHEADTKRYQVNIEAARLKMESQAGAVGPAQPEPAQAAPAAPQPIHIHPGDSVNQGIDVMQQVAAQMAQSVQTLTAAIQEMDAIARAPRHKVSRATRQPDGSFVMESTETVQ